MLLVQKGCLSGALAGELFHKKLKPLYTLGITRIHFVRVLQLELIVKFRFIFFDLCSWFRSLRWQGVSLLWDAVFIIELRLPVEFPHFLQLFLIHECRFFVDLLMRFRLSTVQVLFMLLEQETFMVLRLQIFRNCITLIVVHRHDNIRVFAELYSCTLQRAEKFVSECVLPLKHVWVLIEIFLSKLDNVVFLHYLLVLRSHMLGSLVGPVDLFLCNSSSDAIILKHS